MLALSKFVALATLCILPVCMDAQGDHLLREPIIQLCTDYSNAGALLKASVYAHAFSISIASLSGQIVELSGNLPDPASTSAPARLVLPCQFAISESSDRATLAIPTAKGLFLQLIDLAKGQLAQPVEVPPRFPIQFSLHPMGYIGKSGTLAVSQAHYQPTGEPEVSTQFVSADGSITAAAPSVFGPKYAEVTGSSFDFRGGRVWFLCPAYSARVDRQPRCTLTSAPLREGTPALEIPPPPDDRVVGSGQPNLGFPSPDLAVLLAQDRLWLYTFSTRSFRQMNLPETPHHIRWSEFPGQPKFSSDGRFAAIPIYMFHYPLFEEGQVPHGTKVVIVDLKTLRILQTIQPSKGQGIVDFSLHNDGASLTLVASWGKEWQSFQVPLPASH
jgi:hypothetical protein